MKKKKNGFTLIELLAVLVITGIVLVIALQTYGHITGNSDNTKYDYQWELIKNATDIYTDGMRDNLIDNDCILVDYSTLKFTNLVKEDDLSCKGYVLLVKNGNKEVYDDSLVECIKGNKTVKKSLVAIDSLTRDTEIVYDKDNNRKVVLGQCTNMFDANIDVGSKTGNVTTNSIKVASQCSDFNYNIKKVIYYLYDKNNEEIESYEATLETEHTFKGLEHNTKYYVKVGCINTVDREANSDMVGVTTKKLKAPKIEAIDGQESNGWYKDYTYRISYDDSNVTKPGHYFQSNISADGLEVTTNKDVYLCINGDKNNCNTKATYIQPGELYKVEGKTIDITYTYIGSSAEEITGNLKGIMSDGNNNVDTTEKLSFNGNSEIKIDSVTPMVDISFTKNIDKYTAEVTCKTGISGVKKITIQCTSDNCSTNKIFSSETSPFSKEYDYKIVTVSNKVDQIYKHSASCTSGSGRESETAYNNLNISSSVWIDEKDPSSTGWKASKTYKLNYSGDGNRYVKSPYDAVLTVNGSSTNIKAGEWYQVTADYAELTISKEVGIGTGSIIIKTGSESVTLASCTWAVSKIDITNPGKTNFSFNNYTNGTWTNQTVERWMNAKDSGSGIQYFEYLSASVDANGNYYRGSEINYNCVDTNGNFVDNNGCDIGLYGVDNPLINGVRTDLYQIYAKPISETVIDAVYYRAVDYAGNKGEWSDLILVKVDKVAPHFTEIKLVATDEYGATLNLSSNDSGGSGVKEYRVSLAGVSSFQNIQSDWKPFFPMTKGNDYTAYIDVIDNAGNLTRVTKNFKYNPQYSSISTCIPGYTNECILREECDCDGDCLERNTVTETYQCGTQEVCHEGGGGGCIGNDDLCAGSNHECAYKTTEPVYCTREVQGDVCIGGYEVDRYECCKCETYKWSDCATGGIIYYGGWNLS